MFRLLEMEGTNETQQESSSEIFQAFTATPAFSEFSASTEKTDNPTENTAAYECLIHKIQYKTVKRDTFEKEVFNALLEVSFQFSYRLYRDVKHGCHCPQNYAAFDRILEEFERSKQTEQK